VRIWARGEAEMPSVGGEGMFLWGLQGAEEVAGRERRENVGWKKKRGRS